MKKIWILIRKEWSEVFKNRLVLFTTAFLPLVFAAIPLGMLVALRSSGDNSATRLFRTSFMRSRRSSRSSFLILRMGRYVSTTLALTPSPETCTVRAPRRNWPPTATLTTVPCWPPAGYR